jgi:hypothetical protein
VSFKNASHEEGPDDDHREHHRSPEQTDEDRGRSVAGRTQVRSQGLFYFFKKQLKVYFISLKNNYRLIYFLKNLSRVHFISFKNKISSFYYFLNNNERSVLFLLNTIESSVYLLT